MDTQNANDRAVEISKDPNQWKTGDEPMTSAEDAYLHTLAREAGEPIVEKDLTKAEASKKIEELLEETGRSTAKNPVCRGRKVSRKASC